MTEDAHPCHDQTLQVNSVGNLSKGKCQVSTDLNPRST